MKGKIYMQQNKQLSINKVAMQIIAAWITSGILQLRRTYTTSTAFYFCKELNMIFSLCGLSDF